MNEKGCVKVGRGGLWVCSSAWCEKGITKRFCKNASRVSVKILRKEPVCTLWLAKPLVRDFGLIFASAQNFVAIKGIQTTDTRDQESS